MNDGFDLDLRNAEAEMDDVATGGEHAGRVVLGILDGTTPPEEWLETVLDGNILLLSVDGDLNELAAPFAADVQDAGGTLMHFREFLVLAPPGIDVDADRV